jgi:hypothetical protein
MKRLAAIACIAAVGCIQIPVTTDYDPDADFAGLRTYGWIPGRQDIGEDPRIDAELLDKRIRTAVDAQLGKQGYVGPSAGTPDFVIGYHALIEEKADIQRLNTYYGYGPRWNAPGPTYAYVYQEGTLILDIVDPKAASLLWRGSARAEVAQSATPEQREKRIQEAVRRILERFPPEPRSD